MNCNTRSTGCTSTCARSSRTLARRLNPTWRLSLSENPVMSHELLWFIFTHCHCGFFGDHYAIDAQRRAVAGQRTPMRDVSSARAGFDPPTVGLNGRRLGGLELLTWPGFEPSPCGISIWHLHDFTPGRSQKNSPHLGAVSFSEPLTSSERPLRPWPSPPWSLPSWLWPWRPWT